MNDCTYKNKLKKGTPKMIKRASDHEDYSTTLYCCPGVKLKRVFHFLKDFLRGEYIETGVGHTFGHGESGLVGGGGVGEICETPSVY